MKHCPEIDAMRRLPSLEAVRWIERGVTPRMVPAEGGAGYICRVSDLVPPIFPAYAKLLHPIYEDLAALDDDLTWQEAEKSTPSEMNALRGSVEKEIQRIIDQSTLVYGGPSPDSRLVRIRWTELARRQGIPFTPTLSAYSFTRRFPGGSWPRRLIGPEEGNLASTDRDVLTSVVRRHTNPGRCLFHFWLLATVDWKDNLLFEGALDEVSNFPDQAKGTRLSPTHWFPENRAWIVCTDYDLTFTLIGGSKSLVDDLLRNRDLECVQVHADTRVDAYADSANQ